MKDMNEFRFSGTVERFDRIQTKTGTPMVSFTVLCWRERVRAVAFKAIAEQTELAPGDRVECSRPYPVNLMDRPERAAAVRLAVYRPRDQPGRRHRPAAGTTEATGKAAAGAPAGTVPGSTTGTAAVGAARQAIRGKAAGHGLTVRISRRAVLISRRDGPVRAVSSPHNTRHLHMEIGA